MMLPIGDSPNPKGFPLVNTLLILLNVAVYLVFSVPLESQSATAGPLLDEYMRMIQSLGGLPRGATPSAYDLFVYQWGFRTSNPSTVDLFTSMFLHGGFMHLFGNMLFLWIYGDNVEHAIGRVRYLLFYLACGAAAVLFHWAFTPTSPVPLVGASGAISGVLGFYFLAFPRNSVRLLWLFGPVMRTSEVSARMVLGIYLVLENMLPFLMSRGGGGGVARGAHIGGFLAGLAYAAVAHRRELLTPAEFRVPEKTAQPSMLRDSIASGRWEEAAKEYFAMPDAEARRALGPSQAIQLATWLRSTGHAKAALAVAGRTLRTHPYGSEAARLHLIAGEVLLEDLGQPTEAFQHLRTVLDREPDPRTASEARAHLVEIDHLQKRNVGHLQTPRPW